MIDAICCGSLRLESMGRIDITWACDPAQIGNTGEAVCKSGMIDARRFREIPESGQVRCVHNLGRETLAVPRKVGFLESAGQRCRQSFSLPQKPASASASTRGSGGPQEHR